MNKCFFSVPGIVLMLLCTSAGAAPGGAAELETRVDELEDRLNALESIIEIDENGNASIKPAGDLIFDAAGMTKSMDDTMIMGSSTLDGGAMIMSGATVKGDTMLDGDTMMMQDATVMGDASLEKSTVVEGALVQPFNTATIVGGELVPDSAISSVMLVSDAADSILDYVPAAASVGTNLRLQAVGRILVDSCAFEADCVSTNILLKPNSPHYRMRPGNVLVLSWNGSVWEELARSNGQAAVATLEGTFGVGGGGSDEVLLACVDRVGGGGVLVPDGGVDNSVLLDGVVVGAVDNPTLDAQYELVLLDGGPSKPGGGGFLSQLATAWGLRVMVQNADPSATTYTVQIRCLVF